MSPTREKVIITIVLSFFALLLGSYLATLIPLPKKSKAYIEPVLPIAQRWEEWEMLALNGVEKDICVAFGPDCKIALAISHAENGTRQCDRLVAEPNGTVSVGLFMINTVHFKRFPVSQLVTCQGNIEAAKQIFTEQKNWSAWSVYKNGSYKRSLKLYPRKVW